MKNSITIIALLVLLSSSMTSFAQSEVTSYKFELGAGLATFPIQRLYHPVNVSFKYNVNKHVFRSGLNYRTHRFFDTEFQDILVNIGYERRIGKGRVQLILGGDICYYYRRYPVIDIIDFDKIRSTHIGIGPVIGTKINITKRLSIQSEIGLFYGYWDDRRYLNEVYIHRTDSPSYAYTTTRFVSLNLYYSFGTVE